MPCNPLCVNSYFRHLQAMPQSNLVSSGRKSSLAHLEMDANMLSPSLAGLTGLYKSNTPEMDHSLNTFRTLIPTTQSEFSSRVIEFHFFGPSATLILQLCHSQGTEYYLVTPSINDGLIMYLPLTNVLTNLCQLFQRLCH